MGDRKKLSSSVCSDNEDQIEKDAEKAYKNMSVEARVFGNLVTGVDDEEFEHVWEDESGHSSEKSTQKQSKSLRERKDEVYSASTDSRRDSAAGSTGILSPSSLAGFQTVSLSALPGSRLRIERASSGTSSEASNSSNETGHNTAISNHDSAVIAASQMKPRGLGGSGNKPEILAMANHVNSLEQAQAEWKMVENIQTGGSETVTRSPEVRFSDALEHFCNCSYLEQHMSHIKPTVRHKGCAALTHTLFGPPRMKKQLNNERNLVFALALCMFDNDEQMHNHVLQTIYKRLAGTKLDCPRYGNHWQVIGFQGMDPSTDLRGCGFLGLMNILYLVTEPRAHVLATNIYKLSLHETQNFPFSVMSINITRIALQTLREGKLNRECNNRGTVFDVFNEFYAGVFYRVYTVWKNQRKTISDSGFVLREIEKYCKNHTNEVLRDFSKAVLEKKPAAVKHEESSTFSRNGSEKVESFSGVCEIQENEEEEVHLV
ncbi:ELMO domain-containing protein 3-like [Dendronephthya gigantea]|uniref:ELMO domain-containing protein 3-like n=1 Tax=Dendronephthya gigantea TaxID=151771 RepID=UPI00106972ED|nr:ELMO domain-containing protein 3-like [Dendronephthya gigantea]